MKSKFLKIIDPEDMVSKSFKQFQFLNQKGKDKSFYKEAQSFLIDQEKLFSNNIKKKQLFAEIDSIQKTIIATEKSISKIYSNPLVCISFLTIGRIVFISGLGWCPVVNFSRIGKEIALEVFSVIDYHSDPFLIENLKSNSIANLKMLGVYLSESPKVISVSLARLTKLSSLVAIIPSDLISPTNRDIVKETIFEMMHQFGDDLPLLELGSDVPISNDTLAKEAQDLNLALNEFKENLRIKKTEMINLYDWKLKESNSQNPETQVDLIFDNDYFLIFLNPQEIEKHILKNSLYNLNITEFQELIKTESLNPFLISEKIKQKVLDLNQLYELEKQSHHLYLALYDKIVQMKHTISNQERIVEHEKLMSMKRVVRRKDFLDDQEVVKKKGRVASHIFGADELLITEILLQGLLVDLNYKQIPVLFSIFVNEDKPDEKSAQPKIQDSEVINCFDQIKKIAKEIIQASQESGLEINLEDSLSALNPSLMDTISKWVEGASFAEICQTSGNYEGTIIRSIKRLYEMLRQLSTCGEVLGNKSLQKNFEDAAEVLNRGIIFAASLYI